MKKLFIFSIATILSITSIMAQDTTATDNKASIKVGLSAGATLYANGNDFSPYYSKYGITLQLPVLWEYNFAPNWRLSTGLRYDFNWDQ